MTHDLSKYTPSTESLRAMWTRGFANVPEKIEFEIGFDNWVAEIEQAAVERALAEEPKQGTIGTRTNPLRLPKDREEFEAQRADESRDDVGVTGSLYPGEEATVTICVDKPGWHDMDVEYAKLIVMMLAESIKGAQKHNAALRKEGKL